MFIVCTFLPKQIPCMCKLSWRINPFLILILIDTPMLEWKDTIWSFQHNMEFDICLAYLLSEKYLHAE